MKFKLTIPEPCHEGWNKMTPNEKGRFCESCCKTVVDFTKKSPDEIKEYFLANRGNRICGHLKKSQLDSVVIQIPNTVFEQPLTFQKIFLLALFLAMGSMLFSCKTDGKTKNIDKIELLNEFIYNTDGYDADGFDGYGYDADGYDNNGVNEDGDDFNEEGSTKITPITQPLYDKIGIKIKQMFTAYRFDEDGYDRNGLNEDGLDRNGYNKDEIGKAYNKAGYDKDGFNKKGLDKTGYDEDGYDEDGYNKDGYNYEGYDEDGNKEEEFEGEMGLTPEIPPLYDEIGSKIVQLLRPVKEQSQDIDINISIDNLGENEKISVKTVSEEIRQKIVRELKSEIIPLIAEEVKKDSYCDFFEYNYKLTV